MILKELSLFILTFYASSGISQTIDQKLPAKCKDESIVVSFYVDGKKLRIENRFVFIIIHNKDTVKAKIIGHRFIVPPIDDLKDYSIVFKYDKYSLLFNRISKKMLIPGQSYKWEFGVDNRPFDQSLDLLSTFQYENDKTIRQLQYVRLMPMEIVDGLRFFNEVKY